MKTNFKRECSLADIPHIIRADGSKGCIWCGDDLKTNHPLQRYCKDKNCPKSAFMWGYPQKDEACHFILVRQDFKCHDCKFDYKDKLEEISLNTFGDKKHYDKFESFVFMKREIDRERRPEVDHIIPINKGGQSLGINNHQVLCNTCHLKKTKHDNSKASGSRREKTQDEIKEKIDKKLKLSWLDKYVNLYHPHERKKYPMTQEDIDYNSDLYKRLYLSQLTDDELLNLCDDYMHSTDNSFHEERTKLVKEEVEKRHLHKKHSI